MLSFTAKDSDVAGEERTPSTSGVERRTSPRIYDCFPAKVRFKDWSGERFEIETALDNIGFRGLYVRLARRVDPGAYVSVEVRLSSANDASALAPILAIHGEVLRAELQTDGSYGIAIEFHQRRLL
jgi:hypothetical protein